MAATNRIDATRAEAAAMVQALQILLTARKQQPYGGKVFWFLNDAFAHLYHTFLRDRGLQEVPGLGLSQAEIFPHRKRSIQVSGGVR